MQPGGDVDLAEKPLGPQRGGQLGPEHFHCHLAMVLHILGEIDRGHAARAEFALEAVAFSHSARNTFEGIVSAFGHRLNLWSQVWPSESRECTLNLIDRQVAVLTPRMAELIVEITAAAGAGRSPASGAEAPQAPKLNPRPPEPHSNR